MVAGRGSDRGARRGRAGRDHPRSAEPGRPHGPFRLRRCGRRTTSQPDRRVGPDPGRARLESRRPCLLLGGGRRQHASLSRARLRGRRRAGHSGRPPPFLVLLLGRLLSGGLPGHGPDEPWPCAVSDVGSGRRNAGDAPRSGRQRPEPGAARRTGAGVAGTPAVLQRRRRRDRRLDAPGTRVRPLRRRTCRRLPHDPPDPRRPSRRLRQRLLLRPATAGRQRLHGALRQPPRLHRLRRGVPLGDVGRLGVQGLRRRHGRGRPRRRTLPDRHRPAGRDGVFVRRLPHQLDHHADRSLRRGCGRRVDLQLGERLRRRRHPPHQGERVLRTAVGGEGADELAALVADRARQGSDYAHPLRSRGVGPPGADRRGGADVRGPEEARRAGALRPLPGVVPRRLDSLADRASGVVQPP